MSNLTIRFNIEANWYDRYSMNDVSILNGNNFSSDYFAILRDRLHLRTHSNVADKFYRAIGFTPHIVYS